MRENFKLKVTISIVVIIVIIVRLIWPDINVDAVTLGLLAIGLLPWLSTLIKSAEFPGGWKVEFQDVKDAGDKITQNANLSVPTAQVPEPSYINVAERDPNLALVGLRIEIERRLQALGRQNNIRPVGSLVRLSQELRHKGILDDPAMYGLQELITAGNQAAHGASVEPQVATWAIDYGPQVLAVLDAKLQQSLGSAE